MLAITTILIANFIVVEPSAGKEPSEGKEPSYHISTIPTGNIRSQTVLTGFLDNPVSADLIIVTVSDTNQRRVGLYRMTDGKYPSQPVVEHALDSDVILMDVGRIGEHDGLVLFGRNKVWQFDPVTSRRKELISISSIYGATILGSVPKIDFLRDLNGDGLDDFIIPGFDGFQVFVQNKQGGFDGPVNIYAPPVVEMSYNNLPWYQPRQSFLSDITLDNRQDLIFWVDDKFSVYSQTEDGHFNIEPIRIKPAVQFDYDGLERMSIAMQDEDQSDSSARALLTISDLDGDNLSDLVTISISSKGVFKKTTTYEIHKGLPGGDVLQFSEVPDSVIESKGIQFEMQEQDFNGDGQTDLVISTVELGIGKILVALITGSIDIDLNFYQMKDGTYPEKPDLQREITATFSLSSGEFFFPSVLIADVDNDGVSDLLIQHGADKLKIYLGGKDGQLFAKRSVDIDVSMPNEPDLIELADLNSDGRMDLVMRHQAVGGPRKVVVMVSK